MHFSGFRITDATLYIPGMAFSEDLRLFRTGVSKPSYVWLSIFAGFLKKLFSKSPALPSPSLHPPFYGEDLLMRVHSRVMLDLDCQIFLTYLSSIYSLPYTSLYSTLLDI